VIFAGSNGRFGHRCQTIEAVTGLKCVNASVAAGYSLVWQISKYLPSMRRGDILYMPLEYVTDEEGLNQVGDESAYLVAYDHASMLKLYSPAQIVSSVFQFGIQDLLESLGEMGLHKAGVKTRYSASTLTRQGDESGHDLAHAAEYAAFVRQQGAPKPAVALYHSKRAMAQVDEVIRMARAKGVIVVGGLPTTVIGTNVNKEVVGAIRDFYVSRGECFVALPNLSLYPVSAFYDSNYHPAEPTQIEHSRRLAGTLVQIADRGGCAQRLAASDKGDGAE
jgi:hypothetical protein